MVTRQSVSRPAPASVVDGPAHYETLAAPGRVEALHVHFAAGSRTRWHTHPAGQLLVVTAGVGWVQSRGQAPERIVAGDVVRVEPGEEHWHGAAAGSAMSHLAIQEHDERDGADVLEAVADDDYPKD
ncbi:cupin domain-containing protein [Micromonospora sp. NBS 11-29]|uniref:cupin domain-containing protein n=1 Tax=Micromonospora sp. NBS 11-29 TaxID=1960879 RepID=UPI000B7776A9|nr:cupin domain-containing protein [Micromonospora sp. NBS 11-29]